MSEFEMIKKYEGPFEVRTQNEDGWTEYHEELDETDDLEVALIWLRQPDCISGEIRSNGRVIAWKNRDEGVQFEEA